MKPLPILVLILSIALVLFVFVPAAFIFLGKVNNPLVIGPLDGITPQYSENKSKTNIANAGGALAGVKNAIDCQLPAQSYEPHTVDTVLLRDGEKSSVVSEAYKYSVTLPLPIYDWQYTKGALTDESASFVYEETIVNILARTAKPECNSIGLKIFKDFHEKNKAVEYFSSRTYVDQGKALGLTKAILQESGSDELGDKDYYWYSLIETYQNAPDRPIYTKWFSTRVGRTEYWFAFRGYVTETKQVNKIAEQVLESIEYKSLF